MINKEQILKICPNAKNVDEYLIYINKPSVINTPLRMAMFIAQAAHESGEFKYTREIWGPTPAQIRYEGRKDLGNIIKGDGVKYKGRGIFQITGRANYKSVSEALGKDFITHPKLLETPEYAVASAIWFWNKNNLNKYADSQDIKGCTKRINGGYNGLEDREKYYNRAKKILL